MNEYKIFRKNKKDALEEIHLNIINDTKYNLDTMIIYDVDNGHCDITIKENKKTLLNYSPGSIITLGEREYIILEHFNGCTKLVMKNSVADMKFGDSNDYRKSYVRFYCNETFYDRLASIVGADNIIPHTVNLTCDDGSNKDIICKDNVSILTMANYRRYRDYLPALGEPFWTATGITALDKDYARGVCYVDSNGVPNWNVCDWSKGVRPFCVLNSSVEIE